MNIMYICFLRCMCTCYHYTLLLNTNWINVHHFPMSDLISLAFPGFENNKSKRWDRKEVWLDAMILDELYNSSEQFNGPLLAITTD